MAESPIAPPMPSASHAPSKRRGRRLLLICAILIVVIVLLLVWALWSLSSGRIFVPHSTTPSMSPASFPGNVGNCTMTYGRMPTFNLTLSPSQPIMTGSVAAKLTNLSSNLVDTPGVTAGIPLRGGCLSVALAGGWYGVLYSIGSTPLAVYTSSGWLAIAGAATTLSGATSVSITSGMNFMIVTTAENANDVVSFFGSDSQSVTGSTSL